MNLFDRIFRKEHHPVYGKKSPSRRGKLYSPEYMKAVLFAHLGKHVDTLAYCPCNDLLALGCRVLCKRRRRSQLASLCVMSAKNGDILWQDNLDWEERKSTKYGVFDLAFSPEGTILCAVGLNGAEVRDANNGKRIANLYKKGWEMCRAVTFSSDSSQVALAATDKQSDLIVLYTTTKWKKILEYRGHTTWISDLEFRPGSRELASGDDEGITIIWDCATGKEKRRWSTSISEARLVTQLSPGLSVDHGSARGIVKYSYDPSGGLLAIAYTNGLIEVRKSESGESVKTLLGHSDSDNPEISTLIWLASTSRLLSSGEDGSIRLWNVSEGSAIWKVAGKPIYEGCHPVAVTIDGRLIEAGVDEGIGIDGKLRSWDLGTDLAPPLATEFKAKKVVATRTCELCYYYQTSELSMLTPARKGTCNKGQTRPFTVSMGDILRIVARDNPACEDFREW